MYTTQITHSKKMIQLQALKQSFSTTTSMFKHLNQPHLNPQIHKFPSFYLPSKFPIFSNNYYLPPKPTSGFSLFCNLSNSDSIPQLELRKQYSKRKPQKLAIFGIVLLNLSIYVADHIFLALYFSLVSVFSDEKFKALYLYHNRPAWYQFVTAAFCHANWNHLSSNLFFLYNFGKVVEEEEGSFALWLSYILLGVGVNLVSWFVLPQNSVSVGASGAVFGLFSMSVLAKMSWRKFIELLIVSPFVFARVRNSDSSSSCEIRTLQNHSIFIFLSARHFTDLGMRSLSDP